MAVTEQQQKLTAALLSLQAGCGVGGLDKTSLLMSLEDTVRKVSQLEAENMFLKSETSLQLVGIENEERREIQLISDCARQLGRFQILRLILTLG